MLCFPIRPIRNNQGGELQITGTAVLRGGLKNGMGTTFSETVWRTGSTVISTLRVVLAAECSRFMQASAIIFFSVGDQGVDVALPICRLLRLTGRATPEAMLGTFVSIF